MRLSVNNMYMLRSDEHMLYNIPQVAVMTTPGLLVIANYSSYTAVSITQGRREHRGLGKTCKISDHTQEENVWILTIINEIFQNSISK